MRTRIRIVVAAMYAVALTTVVSCVKETTSGPAPLPAAQRSSGSSMLVVQPNGDTTLCAGDTLRIIITCDISENYAGMIELSVDNKQSWVQVGSAAMPFVEWDGRIALDYAIPESVYTATAALSTVSSQCFVRAYAYEFADQAFDYSDRPFSIAKR